ncbi:MAG: D-amino-acid transaminase [Candidatus Puniceispirillaceae bacterium]
MSRIAYVNGAYVPHDDAAVSIDDRGYQFGDGVYEVVFLINGHMADEQMHLDRLERSLGEMAMSLPISRAALQMIMARVIRMNGVKTGLVYVQITRGVARRDHKWTKPLRPSVIVTAKNTASDVPKEVKAVNVITVPDERWERRDIKTIQLLPNCLAKQKAYEAGAYEAILIEKDGTITEGSSSNVWIVTNDNEIITRPATEKILNGITRRAVAKVAETLQMSVIERPFDKDELLAAKEAFVTSASSHVTAIGHVDGQKIAGGIAGPVANRLRKAYIDTVVGDA